MPVGFFPDLKLNVATRSSSEMELGLLEVQRLEPGMRMRGPFLGGGGTPPTLAKRLASAFSCVRMILKAGDHIKMGNVPRRDIEGTF
eukprot:scaffold144113_cov19-Tisochrysis_lutea.AAC.1